MSPACRGIAPAQVEPVGEVGRLVAEPEAAYRVALVEQVAHPDLDRPALGFVAGADVRQEARIGTLVVAGVEIEARLAGQVGPRHPARGMAPGGRERRLPFRRVGELTSLEVPVAEAIAMIARVHPVERRLQVQPLADLDCGGGFDAESLAAPALSVRKMNVSGSSGSSCSEVETCGCSRRR